MVYISEKGASVNIATNQTLSFIKEHLPVKEAKILEVGCGRGQLASALSKSGFRVTAIDPSADAVLAAKEEGIDAIQSDILDFTSETRFDAVVFSRSLHHIRPLETVFNKVKSLLDERGRILVEDFAHERIDAATASWFYELFDFSLLLSGGQPEASTPGDGPLERWKKQHHHETALHTGKELLRETERFFGTVHSITVPYLYRYFSQHLEKLPNAEAAMQKIFDWECKSIERGAIQPIGLRIVAKKYFSYLK